MPVRHMIENHPLGATAAAELYAAECVARDRRERREGHPMHCPGIVLALQYYSGDVSEAMELARLLADLEPERRTDCLFVFARSASTEMDLEQWATGMHVSQKFPVRFLQSAIPGAGHPDGCNATWTGIMSKLAAQRVDGILPFSSVFTFEPDGAPLCVDWIERIRAAHARTIMAGKRVTGWLCEDHRGGAAPHVNGNLVAHLSLIDDRPGLLRVPRGHAWDVFHAVPIMQEARPCHIIRSEYGSTGWNYGALHSMARETAWIANVKDRSALDFAKGLLAT